MKTKIFYEVSKSLDDGLFPMIFDNWSRAEREACELASQTGTAYIVDYDNSINEYIRTTKIESIDGEFYASIL